MTHLKYIKHIILIILSIILLPQSSLAYDIPQEYQTQVRNEVEVYILSSLHEGEPWANVILYDQMCQYVGCKTINGREKLNKQMEYYMKFYYTPRIPELSLIGN